VVLWPTELQRHSFYCNLDVVTRYLKIRLRQICSAFTAAWSLVTLRAALSYVFLQENGDLY